MTNDSQEMPTKVTRRNTVAMLKQLPSIFDIKDVMTTFGSSRSVAIQYCVRWKSRELIESMGADAINGDQDRQGRLGIYYNTLKPTRSRLKSVLDRVVRGPYMVIGKSALNQGFLTTQIAQVKEIAVPTDPSIRTYPSVKGVQFLLRPLGWFESMRGHSVEGYDDLPTATAEYALVDTLRSRMIYKSSRINKVWHVDPDDISLNDNQAETDVIKRCYEAAYDLNVPIETVKEYLAQVADLEDYIEEVDPDDLEASLAPRSP